MISFISSILRTSMDSVDLRIRYRPIRFGWCVRDQNLDELGIHLTQVSPTGCGLGYFRLMAESTICL
jgi:hypothetical protein